MMVNGAEGAINALTGHNDELLSRTLTNHESPAHSSIFAAVHQRAAFLSMIITDSKQPGKRFSS
jgi:SLT domain-containing protein